MEKDYKELEAEQTPKYEAALEFGDDVGNRNPGPTGKPEPMGVDFAYEMLYGTMEGLRREINTLLTQARLLDKELAAVLGRIDYVLDRVDFVRGPVFTRK